MSNHEKMLERVRALLAKAASTANEYPEEAELFRAKADELMTKYAIELWQVETAQAGVGARPKPEVKDVNIDWWWKLDEDLSQSLWSVLLAVCDHARCRVAWRNAAHDTKSVPVVGLPSDLGYVDMLFTHLFMQMIDTMDPHPREGDGMIEALVRMKEAGLKWEEIYKRLVAADLLEDKGRWSAGVASQMDFAGKYTRYCAETGRERVRVTPSVFRRSFAMGFSSELAKRLRHQKEEQGQDTGSMALVIRDISLVVQEALYDFFPNMRPGAVKKSKGMVRDTRKISVSGIARGAKAGADATILGNSPQLKGKKELQS